MERVDKCLCRMVWDLDNFEWVAQPANGASGGILIIWNSNIFKKIGCLEGAGFLGVVGFWGEENIPCYLVNVYSPCDLASKRILWENLSNKICSNKGNWCIAGDFNAIRNLQERKGGISVRRELKEFNEFIEISGLVNLPMIGRKFTLYQPNGNCMSRLDRFLFFEEWMLNWTDLKQWGLARSLSDHCPILVKDEACNWGPKPFKFYNVWLQDLAFREMIEKQWDSFNIQGWGGFVLKEKMKLLKNSMKVWTRNHVQVVDKQIEEAKETIAKLDCKGEVQQLSEEEGILKRDLMLTLWQNIQTKEEMARQKSRMTWMKEGDANTSFFHWNLFAKDDWKRPVLEGMEFNKISEAEKELLIEPFLESEVKAAVWNCDSAKAPGPDGLSFGFLKTELEVVKDDILKFLADFHIKSKLRGWIRECLQTNSISALLNGSLTKEFTMRRGLRQRDPLALFLFLIVAEGLNGIISSAVEKALFEGVQIGRGDLRISHLQFADDTLLMGKATEENIWTTKCIMQAFELVSGLKINYGKSSLIGINVNDVWEKEMTCLLNCKSGSLPCKYLGIPLGVDLRRIATWKPLIDTLKRKLSSWSGRFLSLGGRITLINAVLTSLSVFIMSFYLLPKSIIGELDKIRRRFLWGGVGERKKVAWVAWENLLHKKLPTKDNLATYGILTDHNNLRCCWCNSSTETPDHLLVNCNLASSLWMKCYKWWGKKYVLGNSCMMVLEQHKWIGGPKSLDKEWNFIWFAVVWTLWLGRNDRIFKAKEAKAYYFFQLVQTRSFYWAKNIAGLDGFSLTNWCKNPIKCLKTKAKEKDRV
ncbi:hypothetical protein SLEP1_g39339 [Rubroshorea leprosula]|uniref:Reverse transcriptase domain-containing protein n=1 Tax=Rubroshorea leprosula TaxID=152421 RepID=A0AAV5L0N9_9ROSI|nr:hypothetical protein SLEP1_g39339 [Rubroshorea leprosula]